ncbi:MAG: VacJ family lipoprotein [Mariprofundaceae bacterium]
MMRFFFVVLFSVCLSSCATVENEHDPLSGFNRGADSFNDSVDRVSLKPIAQGYQAVTSKPVRYLVSNFYDNATYLNTVLNDFLQGKPGQGFEDFARFVINSTIGFAGLADVASSMGLEKHDEDFGQTLAVWGVDQGAYIVYPFLGPNSVRKTPDFITATATDPLFWLSLATVPQLTIPLTALKYIDKRSRLMEASNMRDELALDPYVFTREAWRGNREYLIYDGNPPEPAESSDDEDWGDDEFDDEESSDMQEGKNTDSAAPSKASPAQYRSRISIH